MPQVNSNRNGMGKIKWAALLGMVIIVVAATLWWQNKDHATEPQSDVGVPSKTDDTAKAVEIEKAAPETPAPVKKVAVDEDAAAAQIAEAAKSVPDAKPIAGAVTLRPEFVSEFEWALLQEVSSQNPEKEKQLTLLVNKLLFFKKYYMWKSLLASEGDTAKRHALAQEVLAMLPDYMEILGPGQVQEMKSEMLADLNKK